MIVYVAFKFEDVDPESPQGTKIVAEINQSCETLRIGFDADQGWVDTVVTDDGDIHWGAQ